MREEGWYRDPYELHTDRWFSDGRPTRLVRDGAAESYDEPPPGDPARPLVPVHPNPGDSSDTKRADAAARGVQTYDAKKAFIAALDKTLGQGPIQLRAAFRFACAGRGRARSARPTVRGLTPG